MRFLKRRRDTRQSEGGQTLLMFVFFLVVLILFIGLGIDLGFAYITKAQLSKGVDAACLAGMINLSQGQTQAIAMATSTFYANYPGGGRDVNGVPPVPSVTFSNDTTCSPPTVLINVQATAHINTYFIRVMPAIIPTANWSQLTISDSAQATRSHLIVTLVLDRSGSMDPVNGTTKGGIYLPGAVSDFISHFDDTQDEASVVSFASTAAVDFPIQAPFRSQIGAVASNLQYEGGTYSPGGLTNGLLQEESVQVASCEAAVKAVVFFTDGRANMVEQTLSCGQAFDFGGFDVSGEGAAFFPTNTPELPASNQGSINCSAEPDGGSMGGSGCLGCSGVNSYNSPLTGPSAPFTTDGITADSEYDCIQIANQMRAQGIYVYAIGLTSAPNQAVNSNFLYEVANDTNSPTYDATMLTGQAKFSNQGSDLDSLFNQIAEQILLRLTK
jgi:Flp pilus assembly protein TadG